MLHPAGLREDLGKLLLGNAAYFACGIEEDTSVGGGSGIQSHNIFGHRKNSFLGFSLENDIMHKDKRQEKGSGIA